jgi:type I restriction enzyme S subunit
MEKQINKIPQVRFREFNDDWEEFRLSELMTRVSKNNKDEEFSVKEILSLSSTKGIVDRKELLGDTYDKVNHKNYIKTRLNDLVYGKSISSAYPYGLFKVNNCRDGLLSTLYFTFKVNDNTNSEYLDRYFSYHNRANNFLKKYVLVGDRYITADANYILSGKIFTPQLPEQQKIAHFFSIVDKKLNQLQEKKTALAHYKKGMMQQIFSQKLRFKDENGNDFTKRNTIELGEIVKIKSGNSPSKYNLKNSGTTPFIKVEELNNCNKNIRHSRYYTDNVSDTIPVNSIIFPKRGGAILTNKVRINSVPLFMDSNLMALICDTNQVNFQFLFYKIVFQKLYKIADTSTIPQINNKHIQPLILELPSLSEQTKIANFLSKIDDKINTVNKQIETTKTYKKGLLQKMFCN